MSIHIWLVVYLPLWKYESQWEGLSHVWWKIQKMFQTTNQIYSETFAVPCFISELWSVYVKWTRFMVSLVFRYNSYIYYYLLAATAISKSKFKLRGVQSSSNMPTGKSWKSTASVVFPALSSMTLIYNRFPPSVPWWEDLFTPRKAKSLQQCDACHVTWKLQPAVVLGGPSYAPGSRTEMRPWARKDVKICVGLSLSLHVPIMSYLCIIWMHIYIYIYIQL